MKVKDLINKLKKFDEDKEILITAGFDYIFFDTSGKELEIKEFGSNVDIGISFGCKE